MALGFGGSRDFHLGVVLEAKNLLRGEMRKVKADTDEAKAKLRGLQTQLQQLEKYSRGMKIGAGITAAGVGMSMLSVKLVDANKQIEEAVGTVGLAAASTNAEWERMEPRVRRTLERLTVEHRGTAEDVSNAWYRMASIGVDVDTFEASADTIMWANTAMRGNTEETAKAIGMAYVNFKEDLPGKTEADKVKYVADMFARITKISPQTGPALAGGLSYAMPVMDAWGMSLEEGVATLGLLATKGIEAERAGTALMATHRQLLEAEDKLGIKFKRSADGSYEFANVLETLHEKYGDNIKDSDSVKKKLAEAFGDEGGRAIVALWGMEDALRGTAKELKNSKGAAEDMAKALENTSGAKLERLSDAWTVFKGSLMKDNAVVDGAVEQLTKLMDALNDLPDWARTLIGGGMAVGGVGGSVAGPAMTAYNAIMMFRMSKGIMGGGLGGPTPVYETNPAAMSGGAAGVAGTAAKTGFMGKAGIFGIAAGLAAGKVAVDDFILKKAQQGLFGKEYVAGFGERTKTFGKAAIETGKAWNPLAGMWGDSEGMRKAWRDVYKTETFQIEDVRREKREAQVKNETFNVNIGTINTKAADGATLAKELQAQTKRTGTKPASP